MLENLTGRLDLTRPFTYADGLASGIPSSALPGEHFCRIFHGVYAHERMVSHPLIRTRAALVIHPPLAFASRFSAGRVYRLPLPPWSDEHVSVFDAKDRRRRSGIRNHVAGPGTPVTVVRGDRVTTPEQTFLELAEFLDLVDLVVVGDDLVRQKLTTPAALQQFCAESGVPQATAAARAAGYVRAGVDSPMETRLRMLIVLAGLPEPVVNFTIRWEDGRVRFRFDLSYPELKLVIEYDGRQHRADLDQWDIDLERRDWFDHNGWMHVAVVARGIYRRPDETLERVHAALKKQSCRDLPRRLAEDWRRYFPVRR